MPKPSRGPRLGGSPAHERIILANLASQLFEHGRITTTEHRAKRLQPLAEKLISKAKRGDLHSRRLVFKTVSDRSVVHYLFTELAPALAERDGGCTRITKIGPRKGDNAPMAVIEVVRESVEETAAAKARAAQIAGKKARATRPAKKAPSAPSYTAEAVSVEGVEAESATEEVVVTDDDAEPAGSAASAGSPASPQSAAEEASAGSAVSTEATSATSADSATEVVDAGPSDRA